MLVYTSPDMTSNFQIELCSTQLCLPIIIVIIVICFSFQSNRLYKPFRIAHRMCIYVRGIIHYTVPKHAWLVPDTSSVFDSIPYPSTVHHLHQHQNLFSYSPPTLLLSSLFGTCNFTYWNVKYLNYVVRIFYEHELGTRQVPIYVGTELEILVSIKNNCHHNLI